MKKLLSLLLSLILIVSMLPAAAAAGFDDVKANDWFADAVDYVVSNNLMGGYNATTFGPNDTLSRAMVVQVLYNKESKPVVSGKHDFNDVSANDWFNNAVTWGTNKGVMSGYGGGKFAPNDSVTLEQLAVILWNYSGNPTFTASADSVGAHSSWASNGLGWAVENSILTNVPYKAVTDKATRAQTAQVLTNYLVGSSGTQTGSSVTAVTLNITSHKMGEGHTQSLKATVSPADATNTTIVWSSSDPKIATVDQNGKVTGVSGGIATITAKSVNGKTATCTVDIWHSHKLTETKTVGTDGVSEIYTCPCGHSYDKWIPAVRVKSIDLGTASASVEVGKSITLKATITPTDATFKNVTWRSSDTKVVTVSNGVVTGVAPGTARIYATADGKEAYCEATVKKAPTVYSGTGSKVIRGITLPEGLHKITLTHTGKSNFIVRPYDSNGKRFISIANEIGNYTGSIIFDNALNQGYFEVDADGSWTITIDEIQPGGTSTIKGTGHCVSSFFSLPKGAQVVSLTHNGKSNFIVRIYDSTGRRYSSLSNEIGAWSGEAIFNYGDPNKQFVVEVDADGDWIVDFGLGESVTHCTNPVPSSNPSGSSPSSSSSGSSSSDDKLWTFSEVSTLNQYAKEATTAMNTSATYINDGYKKGSTTRPLYYTMAVSNVRSAVVPRLEAMQQLAADNASLELTGGEYGTLLEMINATLSLARTFSSQSISESNLPDYSSIASENMTIYTKCLNIQKITVQIMESFL